MLISLAKVEQSHSVAFADYVRASEGKGWNIVKMQTGDHDFATPPQKKVVRAAYQALLKGETKCCDSRGFLLLRKTLAEKLKNINKVIAAP